MSCMDLIQCLSIFFNNNFRTQTQLIFDLLDPNRDGKIEHQECLIFAKHCVNWNQQKYSQVQQMDLQIQRKNDKLFKDVPSQSLTMSDLSSKLIRSKGNLFEFIFNFISVKLQVQQRVTAFTIGMKGGLESTCSSTHLLGILKQLDQQEEAKETFTTNFREGLMYRAINGLSLKSYYYKLIGEQLFAFKKDSPHEVKTMTYIGHSSFVVPFVPKIQTQSNQPIYGLEVVSGSKSTQYFILEHDTYEGWKDSLTNAMGLSGLLVDDYEVVDKIGEGKFGKVLKGIDRNTHEQVAIKAVQKSKLDQKEQKMLHEQLQIQKQCVHPSLVRFLGKYEDREYVYIVMEYVKGCSLRSYMKYNPQSSSVVARGIIHQVAMALYFLKQFGIIHRDVKPSNILLTGYCTTQIDEKTKQHYKVPQVKLTDYGFSTSLLPFDKLSLFCGSRNYTAPQIFCHRPYSFSIDIYSLGVVLYQLITGILPIQGQNYDQFVKNALDTEPCYHQPNGVILPIHISYLLKQMLAKDPKNRIGLDDLLTSRYLLQNNPLLLKKRLSCSKRKAFSLMTSL